MKRRKHSRRAGKRKNRSRKAMSKERNYREWRRRLRAKLQRRQARDKRYAKWLDKRVASHYLFEPKPSSIVFGAIL